MDFDNLSAMSKATRYRIILPSTTYTDPDETLADSSLKSNAEANLAQE